MEERRMKAMMTQKEFDDKLNELRRRHTEESLPLKQEIDILNAKRRSIGYEICALQSEISAVVYRRDMLERRLKEVGARYYYLKKELIESCPKTALTAAERGVSDVG